MRKVVGLISLVLVLLSILSGCGGTKQATTKPAKSVKSPSIGPGTYTASFGGVDISLTLPAGDDPLVQAIRGFAAKVQPSGQTPVTLGSFTVKNGSSSPTRCELFTFSLTFADGKQVDGIQASEYVGTLQEAIPDADESGLYNEGVNLYNQLIEPTDIMPGASRTLYCVFKTGDLVGLKKVFASQYSNGTKEMKKQ